MGDLACLSCLPPAWESVLTRRHRNPYRRAGCRLPVAGSRTSAPSRSQTGSRPQPFLADVGGFADRLAAELLLVVDVAGGGIELVLTQEELDLFKRGLGVIVERPRTAVSPAVSQEGCTPEISGRS